MANITNDKERMIPLEALRGMAALVVVATHTRMTFNLSGPSVGGVQDILVNGAAAVSIFFVLSGYVLSIGYFRTGNNESLRRSVAKRWPRLAGPIFVVTMFSYVLFHFGLYFYKEAAAITGEGWLAQFGCVDLDGSFRPSFRSAVYQGLFGTLFQNQASYNNAFWTMYHEMMGSLFTFGLAFVLRQTSLPGALWIGMCAFGLCCFFDIHLVDFLAGVTIAFIVARHPIKLSLLPSIVLMAIGIYLAGYYAPYGWYRVLQPIYDNSSSRYDLIGVHATTGGLLVFVLVTSPVMARLLSTRGFALLGRASFPVYLLHIPILFSVGAGLFALLNPELGRDRAIEIAMVASAAVLVVATAALVLFDEWWLGIVNDLSRRLMRPAQPSERQVPAGTPAPPEAPLWWGRPPR